MVDFDDSIDVDSLGFTRMSPEEQKDSLPSFDVLPAGNYPLCVKAITAKKTKAGGRMISIQLVVEDGPHRGRVIFQNENMVASPEKRAADNAAADKLESIGKARISSLMDACGVQGNTVSAVVGNSLIGVVAVRPAKDGYPANNEVKKYLPANGGGSPVTVATTAAPQEKKVPNFMKAKAATQTA